MFKIIITIIVIFVLLYGAFSWFCIIRDLISKIKHKKDMKNNKGDDECDS